ncbi:hypothetical protein PF004_g32643 [Phytophthora fragariae]|uniref:Uncharacterized protein n=1 Tax=Phytophthora fragariae TaxID=53985 RepID=A0A6G0M5N0_9STRA|nr:hypothetical protein PF004_g32643 [Phytophthora fragariae]
MLHVDSSKARRQLAAAVPGARTRTVATPISIQATASLGSCLDS